MSYALHSLAMAFGFLGLVFLLILLHGVLHADKQALIAFDQWLAVCFLNDAYADETISAWAHRKHHKRTERFINRLFNDPNHCAKAYISEMRGAQNNSIYQQEQ